MSRIVLLLGALLAAVVCFAATTASAQRSLECQMVWTGASSDNSILTCLSNSDRLKSQWRYYLYPGFAALIFIFTIVGLPIVFCCNCCSCCESCSRPDKSTDPGVARCGLWMWIFISVMAACGVCVLLVYGVVLLTSSVHTVLDDAQYKTLAYFNGTRVNITDLLTNYSSNPPTPPSIDLSAFDDIDGNISHYVGEVRDDYFKYFTIAEIVVICVGGVGVLLMLCMLIFACCRCGGCCPIAWSCLYFFFALIFALLAVLFTVVMYALFAVCGEVNLQYKREPGVLQWFGVPWCDSKFDFAQLRSDVQTQVASASQEACAQLLEHCDNDPVYTTADSDKIFVCGNHLTASSQCTTLDDVVDAVLATYVKPILTNTLCANQTGLTYLEKCTLPMCAERCVDYKTPDIPAKTDAIAIMQATAFVENVSTALSYVMPLLECNFLIDKIINTIESPNYDPSFTNSSSDVHSCSSIRTSSVMLGTGFFVGALMFILGIYIMHRGKWMWSREAREDSATSSNDPK